MQLVSTFAYVYFKHISAALESICYLGPHAWHIKENEIKQARQKRKEEKTIRTSTDTVYKGSRFVGLSNASRFDCPINTVMRMSSAFS